MDTMKNQNDNPHDLCTWRDASGCADCHIEGRLKCRHNWGDLLAFILLSFTALLPAGIGMHQAGYGWWLLAWVGYALFFFNVWETKVLCSHCPFYALEGKTLACLANHGCLKLWDYDPAPMSLFDKVQFLVGATLAMGAPLPFLVLGEQWLMLTLTVLGLAAMIANMQRNICTSCVNFSCPANRVPKQVVDAYLKRNPVMLKAWQEKGYTID